MNIAKLHSLFLENHSICIDTRKLTEGAIFFALKGRYVNGNLLAQEAIDKGASYAVVDEETQYKSEKIIIVDDVIQTLQNLAIFHRKNYLKIPIIALTGSNGKTTTKELIKTVLSTTYKCEATKGNLNNHLGVPLTLLSFTNKADIGIVEMGANHQKEIALLCSIALPDYGLITNFGKAHLEGFGGVEGVIKGKSEMYDYLKEHHKIAFINSNDNIQIRQIGDYTKIISFGENTSSDCTIKFLKAAPFVSLNYENTTINSKLIGDYNFGNIAVAIAIGKHFKVSTEDIKDAIELYEPDNNRSEIKKIGTNRVILDAYNANPTSMLAALESFNKLETQNKYLFLGDMFELGIDAKEEHQAIVNFAENTFSKNIYFIGENFFKTTTNENSKKYANFEGIITEVKNLNLENSTILIKGSRGMALERILDYL